MKKIERTQLFLLLSFLIILASTPYSLNINALENRAGESPRLKGDYLTDGTATYHSDILWDEYDYGVDKYMALEVDKEVTQTVLSDTTVRYEKDYQYTPGSIYQRWAGMYFYPDYVEVEFRTSGNSYIASNPDMDFTVTTEVNTEHDYRTFYDAPYDAYYSALYATFLDSYYYYDLFLGLYIREWLGSGSSYTELFDSDAPMWDINDSPYPDFTVTGFSTFQGYSTVILEADDPGGYTNYEYFLEYERYHGMLVREYGEFIQPDYLFTFSTVIDDISKLVDDGDPVVEGLTLVEVKNTKPITLSYNGSDINYDHYNFYKDGVLIETNTAWKSQFDFIVTPIKGNSTYTFEVVDSLGNNNSIDTLVIHIGGIPGFTATVAVFAIFAIMLIKRNTSKKRIEQ